jgi:fructokinase
VSVLVAGEALIDMLTNPDDLSQLRAVPGGGCYNLARTLGRLGTAVNFAGGISNDGLGQLIVSQLTADQVAINQPLIDAPTTLALAAIGPEGSATYQFYVEGTAAPILTQISAPADCDVWCVGTLGLVLEPMASTIAAAVAALPAGVTLIVDPNCRPVLISDRDAYLERLWRVIARAAVIKVSTEDATYLFPGLSPLAAARELLSYGGHLVLVTDGGEAVHAVTQDDHQIFSVPQVQVVDTVGAGDTFLGGFVAFWLYARRPALTELRPLKRVIERAIQVAGVTCQRPGANPPWLAELELG